MITGIEIDMGGEKWVVPPLTIGQLMTLAPQIETLNATGSPVNMTPDQIGAAVAIVHAALKRNYPTLTAKHLRDDLLDVGNLLPATVAVMFASGLKPTGEAPAETSAPVSAAS